MSHEENDKSRQHELHPTSDVLEAGLGKQALAAVARGGGLLKMVKKENRLDETAMNIFVYTAYDQDEVLVPSTLLFVISQISVACKI